ncbi:hypothetical protein DBR40_24840 [Pedobacter sp. KBW01]|uniref:DUF4406 domain-containing protein n=1 Tax=Pedobacter sp. KBW01 TaxID=2153364 RepID=UPI000F5A612E|nr:DUF4406 domain-containing protein [Pedobacter sp. KBW01]RQO65101.1 hypothetical protein DBR40_24840 [Pedobacter sp. KBW01]
MNKPKLYISGAITGKPDLNRTKFANATKTFRDLGYIVVNPHEICYDLKEDEWNQCMRRCIIALMDCDTVILLDDWQSSTGATVEYQLAFGIGMEVFNIDLFLKCIQP